MAYYAALVSLVQLLEDIIHRNRYQNLLLGIQQQMAPLYHKFTLLQRLLDDYSPKDREEADFLERRIRDVAYRAQDIIESHISSQVHLKRKKYGGKKKRIVRDMILAQPNAKSDNRGLEEVREQVDSILEPISKIKESQTAEDLQLNYHSTEAGTSPAYGDTMEGVAELLMIIKDQLCGEPSKLQVVSIVGMGGIGKTTLAKNIYHDNHMMYHFDCRAWVTVSQNYHFKKVLVDILDSINVPMNRSSEVAQLGVQIYKYLNGRRYLIVIDDMWEIKVWDDIKSILPDDSNGSRIIITTRISDVASYAGTLGFSHHMEILNENQSWDLFRKKVFCPPELEDIGRLIAKNCCGLPLAIVVIAGLLSKVNKQRSNWEEIARNISSTAVDGDEQFSKILSLSYYHLPHHPKPLFLYMGSFPDDNKFRVFDLIMFWIAEGFLESVESKSLEEVAEEYLDDLVKRNLVLITEKTFNGKIKHCGIHDVLRDLCKKIVCSDNFFHVLHEDSSIYPTATGDVRRIYFYPHQLTLKNAKKCGPHVRFIFHGSRHYHPLSLAIDPLISLSFVMEFRLLRILRVVDAFLCLFPIEILELFHLRDLALCESVLPIPSSISKLQNLQTLILVASVRPRRRSPLPSQIWEMPNLRHVMVTGLELASLSKERIVGQPNILENLQTLSWVANVSFSNEVIEMIPNLKKLKVSYHESSSAWQRFHLNNLFRLRRLKTLIVYFDDWCSSSALHPFPEGFSFPSNLSKLSLKGCRIPWKDMTVVGSLPNLQILKLGNDAFLGEKWECVEGEFPQLRSLLMENLGIMYWQAQNTHFPRLQRLKISHCRNLQDIPVEIGEISTLELVEVNFSKLVVESALQILEEQQDMGNYVLQVRVYPQYSPTPPPSPPPPISDSVFCTFEGSSLPMSPPPRPEPLSAAISGEFGLTRLSFSPPMPPVPWPPPASIYNNSVSFYSPPMSPPPRPQPQPLSAPISDDLSPTRLSFSPPMPPVPWPPPASIYNNSV